MNGFGVDGLNNILWMVECVIFMLYRMCSQLPAAYSCYENIKWRAYGAIGSRLEIELYHSSCLQ